MYFTQKWCHYYTVICVGHSNSSEFSNPFNSTSFFGIRSFEHKPHLNSTEQEVCLGICLKNHLSVPAESEFCWGRVHSTPILSGRALLNVSHAALGLLWLPEPAECNQKPNFNNYQMAESMFEWDFPFTDHTPSKTMVIFVMLLILMPGTSQKSPRRTCYWLEVALLELRRFKGGLSYVST